MNLCSKNVFKNSFQIFPEFLELNLRKIFEWMAISLMYIQLTTLAAKWLRLNYTYISNQKFDSIFSTSR